MRRSTLLCCLLLIALASRTTLAADPPNVVYIMADELGYYELSCMGSPHIKTPNIDRMAREGLRFTQALAGSSLCAPTRAVLMTGKHSGHTSVRTNGGGTPLRAGEATIASVLKQKDYATGGFGKWGCGGRGSTGVPEAHGFDRFVGYYDQVHAHSYYPPYLVENSAERPLPGNIGGREGETYSHTVIFEEALEFIRSNKDRPFFCYLPVTPPHGMFDLPDDDPAWQIYKDEPWTEDARRYAAMVTMLDRQVGQVFSLLKELALDENTIVFFCGDNGGADYFKSKEHPRGFHGANVHPETGVEFRGRKGNLYEGGLRIPMIARWPGRIEPGRVSDHLWYFADVLPTLAELTGTTAPDDIDGLSIVPELLGAEAAGREQEQHEYLYWELGGQTAVRMGSWKAIRPGQDAAWELYDLSQDVSETTDLSAKHPEILAKMKAYAEEAHEPVREGTYGDTTLHEKDRQAKWGSSRPRQSAAKVHGLDSKGLISNTAWKIVRASSASEFNGKLPKNAIDGDPRTIWHTRWQGELAEHPHEIVLDLGASYGVRGVRYLARQDDGWNGSIGQFELFVGDSPTDFGEAVLASRFEKVKTSQEATFQQTTARYVKLRVLSEVNGGPWASIAELGVLGEPADELPDPDGKPADLSLPVQVYILLGQSNMLGFGKVQGGEGSLEHAVKEKGLYPYLIDDAGNWTVRQDVRYVRVMGSGTGGMRQFNNEPLTVSGGKIGPEIGIGHHLGHATEAPVLILKSCIGNRSLGWDLLPPGQKQYEYQGNVYAGYRESPDKWAIGETPEPIGWYAGMQYDGDIARAKKVLVELDQYYPGAKGYEIAGFFWWQGDKDRYQEGHAVKYEENLVALIQALRKDFEAPQAKFVLATLGQTEKGATGNEGLILEAMLAVDGESGKHPEFRGNVATVYSHPLSKGGASNGHYDGNAETYQNIGEAMGRAMVRLIESGEK